MKLSLAKIQVKIHIAEIVMGILEAVTRVTKDNNASAREGEEEKELSRSKKLLSLIMSKMMPKTKWKKQHKWKISESFLYSCH